MKYAVKEFFDKVTWTLTYVVYDEATKDAIILDPVWDYDPESSKLATHSADLLIEFVKSKNLNVHYVLETHAHADHVTGSQYLKNNFPNAKIGIGAKITEVQNVFKKIFNLDESFKTDGSQFDILMEEGKTVKAGSISIDTIYTPGHTPACVSYIIGDGVFTGDALFMPDSGTGRCDFPAGSSADLFASVQKPDNYEVYVGHDYLPGGRPMAFKSTIGEEKQKNIQLRADTTKEQYCNFRDTRDKNLAAPRLLLPSVQLNIAAGKLPTPEANGLSYLKIPLR